MFESNFDDAATAGWSNPDIVRQADFEFDIPYKFRVVLPIVIPVHRVFYPCLVVDEDTREVNQGWRVIRQPIQYDALGWKKEPTILDKLREIDLRIRRSLKTVGSKENIRSTFDPQKIWVVPVFDRRDDEPLIKCFEFGWTIFDGMRKLQDSVDEDDKEKLAHGPIFVHDIVIEKKKKKEEKSSRMKDRYNITYKVRSAKDNKFAGKIDKKFKSDKNALQKFLDKAVKWEIFTEDEAVMIKLWDYNAEFVDKYIPMAAESILETVALHPVCLDAIRDEKLIFPDAGAFVEELKKAEIGYGYLEPPKLLEKGVAKGDVDLGELEKVPEKTEEKEEEKNDLDLGLDEDVKAEVEEEKPKSTKKGKKTGDKEKPGWLAELED